MNKRSLLKSTGVIGLATAISRVLGFLRDIVIAVLFGTSPGAQAFFVAFRIPNSLRDLVAEGATNAAIVPVLTEYKAVKDEREFIHVARVLFNISFVVLLLISVIGIIFSPYIVKIIAPGFSAEPEKFNLTVSLNRVIFPYLILIGLTAYSTGILNTLKHFAGPAFGPCLMNIALIASAIWLCPNIGIVGLAVGVLIGGTLQLLLNVPFMYKHGVTLSFKDGFMDPAVKRIGRLLVPRALGSAVYQINIFVDTILASFAWIVGPGGVAALYYANRLFQFPLGIFGLALAQAALPKLSQEFALNDIERFKDTLAFSLRSVVIVMVPATFGLAILGERIIKILFERGAFTAYSTLITQSALFYYSFGLVAYAAVKLLVTSFYSMHDTKTPVKVAFFALIVNVVLSLILMWPLQLGGLALATSISAFFNFTVLYIMLRRKIGDFGTRDIASTLLRVLAASIIMASALRWMLLRYPNFSILGLFVIICASLAVFIGSAYLLRVKEVKGVFAWLRKR